MITRRHSRSEPAGRSSEVSWRCELRPLGDGALRFSVPSGVDARVLLDALRATPGVLDAVVTERHASVCFDEAVPDLEAVIAATVSAGRPPEGRLHTIRVRYDGLDLDAIAEVTGLGRAGVIAVHTGVVYTVRSLGFMPGFAYLGDLPTALRLPRRASPRARVPAGSVAIAGSRTAVYPAESPGGWHVMGLALDFVAFDSTRGATLQLGERVRFEAAP